MKVIIVTPLYPPDTAPLASYIKELARRLACGHKLTIVTYGNLPEQIKDVRIIAINKRARLPLRLIKYTIALIRAARRVDFLYVENGESVELPALVAHTLARVPLIMHIGDAGAYKHASQNFLRGALMRAVMKHARAVITDIPLTRPEIMPFGTKPIEQLTAYEKSWEEHLRILYDAFK